MENNKLMVL